MGYYNLLLIDPVALLAGTLVHGTASFAGEEGGREREREREGEREKEGGRGRDRGGLYYLAVNQTAVDWPIEGEAV